MPHNVLLAQIQKASFFRSSLVLSTPHALKQFTITSVVISSKSLIFNYSKH